MTVYQTVTTKVTHQVTCPVCGQHKFDVDHVLKKGFHKWSCETEGCNTLVSATFVRSAKDVYEAKITHEAYVPPPKTRSMFALSEAGGVFFVTYPHDCPYPDSRDFYYNSHTCASNIARDVEEFMLADGEVDPHGIFIYLGDCLVSNAETDADALLKAKQTLASMKDVVAQLETFKVWADALDGQYPVMKNIADVVAVFEKLRALFENEVTEQTMRPSDYQHGEHPFKDFLEYSDTKKAWVAGSDLCHAVDFEYRYPNDLKIVTLNSDDLNPPIRVDLATNIHQMDLDVVDVLGGMSEDRVSDIGSAIANTLRKMVGEQLSATGLQDWVVQNIKDRQEVKRDLIEVDEETLAEMRQSIMSASFNRIEPTETQPTLRIKDIYPTKVRVFNPAPAPQPPDGCIDMVFAIRSIDGEIQSIDLTKIDENPFSQRQATTGNPVIVELSAAKAFGGPRLPILGTQPAAAPEAENASTDTEKPIMFPRGFSDGGVSNAMCLVMDADKEWCVANMLPTPTPFGETAAKHEALIGRGLSKPISVIIPPEEGTEDSSFNMIIAFQVLLKHVNGGSTEYNTTLHAPMVERGFLQLMEDNTVQLSEAGNAKLTRVVMSQTDMPYPYE